MTPLSPPPSLYTEEEEEEDPSPRKKHVVEEEPVLPSTPESGSSNSSASPFRGISEKANRKDEGEERMRMPEDDDGAATSTHQEVRASSLRRSGGSVWQEARVGPRPAKCKAGTSACVLFCLVHCLLG